MKESKFNLQQRHWDHCLHSSGSETNRGQTTDTFACSDTAVFRKHWFCDSDWTLDCLRTGMWSAPELRTPEASAFPRGTHPCRSDRSRQWPGKLAASNRALCKRNTVNIIRLYSQNKTWIQCLELWNKTTHTSQWPLASGQSSSVRSAAARLRPWSTCRSETLRWRVDGSHRWRRRSEGNNRQ